MTNANVPNERAHIVTLQVRTTAMRIMSGVALVTLIAATASCTHQTTPPGSTPQKSVVSMVDDANAGLGLSRIHYSGHWEHVRGRYDGRDAGTSSRSFHVGDNFAVAFDGYRLRVYGIVGPRGGHGLIGIDDVATAATIDFYAPVKRTHVLVYTSPVLGDGFHVAAVIVDPRRDRSSLGSYVNVDSLAIEAHHPPPVARPSGAP
jgi:hypothetical protein